MRFYLLLLSAVIGCLLPCTAQLANAQSIDTAPMDWRSERMAIEGDFSDDLQKIAQWCQENGMAQQADPTLALVHHRDLGRQYIFLPSENSMPRGSDDLEGQWQTKINQAKIAHASRIFKLATMAGDQGDGAVAFQLLHEVIHHDLDHIQARKTLGHAKADDGWRVNSDSVRVKPGQKNHDVINWPAGSYIRVLTPHFEIESDANEERTRYLAEQLERAHTVWRQLFFEYWSSSAAVKRWIHGQGSARMSNKRFRVVFFRDKASYVQSLAPTVRGIEDSSGYYNNDQEISFFYDGDESVQDTWRHELTHQLFRESGRSNKTAFEDQFIWLDEGIATYFESMSDFESFVILGGFDSRRIQYARFQQDSEQPPVPLEQLSTIGRTSLQQRPDMARLYSQSAGLVDMLMNSEHGALEKPLIDFLRIIYKGRVKSGAFEEILGKSFDELDQRYKAHLLVNSELVEKHLTRPEARTELSLPEANLSSAAFDSIGKCTNLIWLDLSGNSVRTVDLAKLKSCLQLNQLFLHGCRFEYDTLVELERFPKLEELDLSGSSVQDAQLASFKDLPRLKSLRLRATGITDQGLMHLAEVQTLQVLDVVGTKVTNQGVATLQTRLPHLKVNK